MRQGGESCGLPSHQLSVAAPLDVASRPAFVWGMPVNIPLPHTDPPTRPCGPRPLPRDYNRMDTELHDLALELLGQRRRELLAEGRLLKLPDVSVGKAHQQGGAIRPRAPLPPAGA